MLETIKHIILHPLIDSLKLVPVLLVVYILIELFERKASAKIKMGKVLSGKLAPLIGSAVGTIPQCGFGVIASQFYANKIILPGTLIAIFISTSDEALPLLLAEPTAYGKILPLLGIKFLYAAAMGFLINFIYARLKKRKNTPAPLLQSRAGNASKKNIYKSSAETGIKAAKSSFSEESLSSVGKDAAEVPASAAAKAFAENATVYASLSSKTEESGTPAASSALKEAHDPPAQLTIPEADGAYGRVFCSCGHDHAHDSLPAGSDPDAASKAGFKPAIRKLARFLKHPVKHALTTFLFVFAVGLALEVIIELIGGEEILSAFMDKMLFLQPVLAAVIGLIPSCASSVAITELYIAGTLSLGAALAGLSVNAGVALAVLFKDNKKFSENITITALLYGLGLLLGYTVTLVQYLIAG